jgi:U3 small nucleolar RNA-associated protein 11
MSLKHVVHKRVHLERAQPKARAKLGLLEKHKDYVKRARDYHKKEDTLKKLHQKAYFRNEDEFAFGMISKKMIDGQVRTKHKHMTEGELRLLDSQDAKYVAYKEQNDKKAAEKQAEQLHYLDADKPNKHTLFFDSDDDEAPSGATTSKPRRRDLAQYDLAAHFNTHPSLLAKKSNRLTLKQLESGKFADRKELDRDTHRSYKDLFERQERAKKLARVRGELELRNHLRTKGKRRKVADGENGQPAVYKWQFKRKR